MRKVILEKSHLIPILVNMVANTVTRNSLIQVLLRPMKEFILGKNLMAAATVKRNLPDQQLLTHMKGLTLGKNHMAVNTVIRNLLHYNLLNHMKGLTLHWRKTLYL